MNKQELTGALSHIHASESLKQEVLAMKSKPNPNFCLIAKRAAVCAAALALLIGTVLLADRSGEQEPLLAVIVYANDNESVELQLPERDSAVSNVPDDWIFDSNLPNTEKDNTRFFFAIRLDERFMQYESYKVYRDGKELEKLITKELKVAPVEDALSGEVGIGVIGNIDQQMILEFHFLDQQGELLLSCTISVMPVDAGHCITLENVYSPKDNLQ